MAVLWQISGRLDGADVNAQWDEDLGLVADGYLWEACMDAADAGGTVQATPTGPSWPASVRRPDAAWATVRAVLDEVTYEVGQPPGYPWGVPEDAIC